MEEKYVYQLNPSPAQKLPNIEGLAELREATNSLPRHMQEGIIYDLYMKPWVDVQALGKQYPRAAAYLVAETWKKSPSFVRSRLGAQACEKIAAGEDYGKAIEDMEDGFAAFKVAQEERNWTDAKKNPPKVSTEYIVMIDGAARPTTLYYDVKGDYWYELNDGIYPVTHWMPLPEPPVKEIE